MCSLLEHLHRVSNKQKKWHNHPLVIRHPARIFGAQLPDLCSGWTVHPGLIDGCVSSMSVSFSHCINQILESVSHIHQHDIVHRDLKVSCCISELCTARRAKCRRKKNLRFLPPHPDLCMYSFFELSFHEGYNRSFTSHCDAVANLRV